MYVTPILLEWSCEKLFSVRTWQQLELSRLRKHLTADLVSKANHELGSTLFTPKDVFSQCVLFCSVQLALLLSTFDRTDTKVEGFKPKIVEFYNHTKALIDALDQKIWKARHLLLVVFFGILGIAYCWKYCADTSCSGIYSITTRCLWINIVTWNSGPHNWFYQSALPRVLSTVCNAVSVNPMAIYFLLTMKSLFLLVCIFYFCA